MCSRRSEISALVVKKTGLDGNRTLIHSGFLGRCNDGSIFEQDISEAKLPARASKSNLPLRELESLTCTGLTRFLAFLHPRITGKETFLLQCGP